MAGPTPIKVLTAGFDWFGRSGRVAFVAALLVWGVFAATFAFGVDRPDWPGWARTISLIGLGVTTVPLYGHAMRRLNDLGWSGWWVWFSFVPYVNLVFALVLALRRGNPRRLGYGSALRLLGLIGVCLFAVLVMSRLFWTPYTIPAGSMKPTLLIGDYAIATPARGMPVAGAVIVFRHPVTEQEFVKRVIGLPGDTVQMVDGLVQINGASVPQSEAGFFDEVMGPQGPQGLLPRCLNGAVGQGATCQKRRFREVLAPGVAYEVLSIADTPLDDTPVFTVPLGHLFLLGDNRDNSTDSRFAVAAGGLGMVPVGDVTGRVRRVVFSFGGTQWWQFWTWRADRYWVAVQ